MSEHQYNIQQQMTDPISFATSMNPDIMYTHQAMQALNCDKFLEAMATGFQGHK